MKPIKITGFLVVTMMIILLIPYFFSDSGISVLNYTIRIPEEYFRSEKPHPQYKDISGLKTLLKDTTDSSGMLEPETAPDSPAMPVAGNNRMYRRDTLNIIQPLEFPDGKDSLLNPFFSTLNALTQNSKLIRILHYGDSQIEADRITSFFRNQMQKQFGGGGIGMIPVTPINAASVSYVCEISSNWSRYSILNTHKKPDEPDYGIMGTFSRFTEKTDVGEKESAAWIFLKRPNIGYSRAGKFNRCKLLFGGNRTPLFVELKKNDITIDADIFPAGKSLKVLNWPLDTGARNLMLTFRGKDSPDFYAISLETDKGIAVDNIPLRGSSGLEFTRIFKTPYYKVLDRLNVKLMILQFGVNAVNNLAGNVPYYESAFLKQLKLLRQSQPDIPVIVIGVSDLSRNTPEGYVTNEAVEEIRDAQRRAAFEAGCVFWDMYEGMGGKNSMPSWVFAQPSLAQKDFIHFNPLGARIIAEMFYRSLMNEYNNYLEKNKP